MRSRRLSVHIALLYIIISIAFTLPSSAGMWSRSPHNSYHNADAWISAGSEHAAKIDKGDAFTWGSNTHGQLGDGSFIDNPAPIPGAIGIRPVYIDCGHLNTAIVSEEGNVWVWGDNIRGQIGDGTSNNTRPLATQAVGVNNAIAVASGLAHTVALLADGTLMAWGLNFSGQLGMGDNIDRLFPTPVPNLENIVAIAAGWYHTLVLRADGQVFAFGLNELGQLGNATFVDSNIPVHVETSHQVVAIDAGPSHNIALSTFGRVMTWGSNSSGQLGDGLFMERAIPIGLLEPNHVVAVAAGGEHCLVLRSDGTVWGWGNDWAGQLGDASMVASQPFPVQAQNIDNAVAIDAGGMFSIALRADGSLATFGSDLRGQLGINMPCCGGFSVTPVTALTPNFPGVAAVAAGGRHSVDLLTTGRVKAWGNNAVGQAGGGAGGAAPNDPQLSPIFVHEEIAPGTWAPVTNATAVTAGREHTVILRANGTVVAFGWNRLGQLGGSINDESSVYAVPVLYENGQPIDHIIAIAAGDHHTLALRSDGTVWAWGVNDVGQLGNEDRNRSARAQQVRYTDGVFTPGATGFLQGVVAIAAGANHSLALTLTVGGAQELGSRIWTWGLYPGGITYRGPNGGPNDPPNVTRGISDAARLILGPEGTVNGHTFLRNIKAIAGGAAHSIALHANGSIWGWGADYSGQLFNVPTGQPTRDGLLPLMNQPAGQTKAIASGDHHNFALLAEGRAIGWGANAASQLGDGPPSGFSVDPNNIAMTNSATELTLIIGLAAGGLHSLATRRAWDMRSAGYNTQGQLGDGSTVGSQYFRFVPPHYNKQRAPESESRPHNLAEKPASALGIYIYPNPIQDRFFIRLARAATETVDIAVSDLVGRKIFGTTLPGGVSDVQVDADRWQTGVYILTARSGTTTESHRIVVAR